MVRYDPDHESDDVVDRRGSGGGGPRVSANLVAAVVQFVFSRFGIGGVLVLLIVGGLGYVALNAASPTGGGSADAPANDENTAFVGFVLDDLQETWSDRLPGYRRAQLVLFRGYTNTACGLGQSASGPFYCPGDEQVYIDLAFFDELARLGAPGDFARAYVIGHEIGHHIQNQRGVLSRAQGRGATGPSGGAVRVELQADCLAGVWAASADARGLLEAGDVEEGLGAAAAIGDDRLQERARGRVTPDSFTHGTSEQRVRWFRRGFEAGNADVCDTFSASRL